VGRVGTALKPAVSIGGWCGNHAGTVAQNVQEHGTGAINIDATRVQWREGCSASPRRAPQVQLSGMLSNDPGTGGVGTRNRPLAVQCRASRTPTTAASDEPCELHSIRRCTICLPAFGCVDGCPVAELDAQSGIHN